MATGTTPTYLLPYPLLTDAVDVHGDIQDLASRLEIVLNAKAGTANPTFTGTVNVPVLNVTSYPKYAVASVTTPITTSPHTVATTDTYIIYNSASAISVTLPAASSFTGRVLNLKTISTGAVTSASSNVVALASLTASSTIFSANTAGKWTTLVSNGTNWVIMAQN